MALQNVDKALFPRELRLTGHISEKKFAVQWRSDGLPGELFFSNLSENYNNRGISQTPTYERLCSSSPSFEKIIDSVVHMSMSEDIDNDLIDDDTEPDNDDFSFSPQQHVTGEPFTVIFNGVAMVTTDDFIKLRYRDTENRFEIDCVAIESKLVKQPKRRTPLCRRN